ncbi:Gfo/Idh/MocA family oxidoreductase [Membranihabitans marinus]|uniref:Gfo/Idh/MocA family oxidoreductase n=1 Tax=Membranihabitans marinus TaxID=1227546 RepID=UPI001F3582BD|nr:Gfo/Idh/MocA family oxidoreductase [Membranihabitans marinus]
MKQFALMGAAGYVAPKHMKAIRDTGHELVAALDTFDSVGILDRYFPNTSFFTEFERFDRHLEKLKRLGRAIDYIVICTPNYLHDAHIRFGLRYGADVICEKPTVLNPWNMDALIEIEQQVDVRAYTILQLRWHPVILQLKQTLSLDRGRKKQKINLTYIAPRGKWYYASWKGEENKSGGIATNIGIHFFDMLIWVFGEVIEHKVFVRSHDRVGGQLELKNASVQYFLSINPSHIDAVASEGSQHSYRSLEIDGQVVDFSNGFEDLHTVSYEKILSGQGFGLTDAQPSINLVHSIRNIELSKLENGRANHPLWQLPNSPHPFSV